MYMRFCQYRKQSNHSLPLLSLWPHLQYMLGGFSDGSVSKESTCNAEETADDVSSTPGSGKSPGGGNGKPLQYPCLGNPLDRGARV